MERDPYSIIKSRYLTEKATVLSNLSTAESNRCVKKCENPKVVFLVNKKANKQEIAKAIEKIYAEKNIKVLAVNTICVKPKARRVRGYLGNTSSFKKAIITLEKGDSIDEQV